MTIRPLPFALALITALAACGGNEPRYLINAAPGGTQQRVAVSTIEVRDVSLPAYAAAAEIIAEGPDGALYQQGGALWADDPVRGITASLVSGLDARTTATVAAEPWPLDDRPQARIDVRVNQIYARADGMFELSGQYAVSSPEDVLRGFVRRFDITTPLAGEGPAAITDAQTTALSQLADEIIATLR